VQETVVFPYIIVPLSVSTEQGSQAVDRALSENRLLLIVAQREGSEEEEPSPDQLYPVGSVGTIMRMLKLPDGRMRILVQGVERARVQHYSRESPFLEARIEGIPSPAGEQGIEMQALVRNVQELLEKAIHLGKNISPEVMLVASNVDDPGRLADLAASNLELATEEAQLVLETADPRERLEKVVGFLLREVDLLTVQHRLTTRAHEEMERGQREYFLRQQLEAIRRELGEGDDLAEEIAEYRRLVEEKQMPEEARDEVERQIRRLERSQPDSAETTVIRTCLDWLTGLPWGMQSEEHLDLERAREVLDADHHGLDEVKERILEFLAVRQLKQDGRSPILCLVGPPGVGKTSLGRSIARALGRRFVRFSLGGVRDEAEIRGHRRTYVGAMPGRILQGIHRAAASNPVFMLDEIDKVGTDFRGDPSSALLEVLDPEQNHAFRDHYVAVPYDLSRVFFITTANLLEPIQPAFRDRMEVLRLSGYTEREKVHIAQRHLVPKQLAENGLDPDLLRFTDGGLRRIIRGYTREAGLRNLEREIASVCRKTAMRVARGRRGKVVVGPRRVEAFLGVEKHYDEVLLQHDRVGVATGLAWTAFGGELLFMEVLAVPGRGKLVLTGRLGEVMKESAQAALSYARHYVGRKGGDDDFFSRHDLHVHAPAGAVPKDGPSAGITVATAILSCWSRRPVRRTLAMTGEITLRGDLLPIGGLKEKLLAARAAGIETLVIPAPNRRELGEIPVRLRRDLEIHFPSHMDEVLELALGEAETEAPLVREPSDG
jgi:ATP-dependent Lon protease